MNLIFPTRFRTASYSISEQPADHAERRFSMVALAVQGCGPVRPVLPERGHFLIKCLRFREVPGILLDAVERRRSMPPGGGQAVVTEVCGVRQTPLRRDVLRELIPDLWKHLAVMNVRVGKTVTKYEELVHFDRRMDLDPILRRFQTMVGLPPGTLPAGEAGSVRGNDRRSLRKRTYHEVMESLPKR